MSLEIVFVAQATSFYSEFEGAAFDELVANITSGPVTVVAVEKPFAVESLNYVLGPVDGSLPGTLRAKYGDIHASESISAATKEIAFFFGDVLTTPSETFAWIKPDVRRCGKAITRAPHQHM